MFFGCRKIYSSADVVVVFVLRELRIFLISLCLPVFVFIYLWIKSTIIRNFVKNSYLSNESLCQENFSEIGDLEIRKF